MRRAFAFFLAVLLLAAHFAQRATADQGIRGRASLGGTLVEGVRVTAYPYRPGTFGPLTGEAGAGSAAVATDGTYALSLPAGRYVVEALMKAVGNTGERPETGDLHCLYSGSPVTVAADSWTSVGLNLVQVAPEQRRAAGRSALTGRVTWKGEPAEKVYLYVYTDPAGAFRGPAHFLQPVAAGTFQVRLPPGSYYLVARKRARGGAYGPIEIGDLFNFYPRNPLVLEEGQEVSVEVPLIERLSQLEEDPGAPTGQRIRVVDEQGRGQPGYYVLVYETALRAGLPATTSARTDGEGYANLPLTPGKTVYLRARQSLGGPLESGETYADGEARGEDDDLLTLTLRPFP